ncbi:MAG: TolC family protein [Thermodesulfovibrionia bacterium]
MKRLSIIFVILCIFMPHMVYAQGFTLSELARMAIGTSERIKVAEEDLYITEKERDRALAVLWPRLSIFGSHTRYSEKMDKDGFILQPDYSNSWGLRLSQSFSLGGRELIAYRIAKESIRKGMHSLDSVREDYLMEVTRLYFELLKAKRAVEIADANVKRLIRHRDASRKRLEIGEVTRTALLRAEAELAGAEAELLKAQNSLSIAKANLQSAVGLEEDFDINEEGIPTTIEPLIKDCPINPLDCLKEIALRERAEIMSMDVQLEIAKDEVRYVKGSYFPNLSIEGVYLKEESEPSPTFSIDKRVYGVLRFDFPFFEGGLRRAEVSQARARFRQVEYNISEMKKRIALDVESAYLNYQTALGVLESNKAKQKYALDNFNAVSKQFEFGLVDSLDVIDANTLLSTTERELANAEYDHQLSIMRLRHALGLLSDDLLNEPAGALTD